jgi:hypothetical protein
VVLRRDDRFTVSIPRLMRATGFPRDTVKVCLKRSGMFPLPRLMGRRQLAAFLQQLYMTAAHQRSKFYRPPSRTIP